MTVLERLGIALVCAIALVGSSKADASAEVDPDSPLADCIVRHESNWDPNAYNARSGAAGLGQFLATTWRTTPYASYSRYDPYASHAAVVWMIHQGRAREFAVLRMCK